MNRQQEMFEFISKHNKEKGYPPTYKEVGEAVGYKSTATVHRHIKGLEKRGLIKRLPTSSRSLEVSDQQQLSEVQVIETRNDIHTVILWQGRRYVFDPVG